MVDATESMRSGFDVNALYGALDAERERRDITWSQLTRELNALFQDVTAARPIATSTVTGMRHKGGLNGNGVIQMLIWLERTPESFCTNWPVEGRLIARTTADRIVRWDGPKIYGAVDAQRASGRLTWAEVARAIGGLMTPAHLKWFKTAYGIGIPNDMLVFRWLGQPAADFTVPLPW